MKNDEAKGIKCQIRENYFELERSKTFHQGNQLRFDYAKNRTNNKRDKL